MKIAISTACYFGDAIIDLLSDAGYDIMPAYGHAPFILVNTNKKTVKDATTAGNRQVLCPTSQWATIAALVNAADGGSDGGNRAEYNAGVESAAPAPAPAAAVNPVDTAGNVLRVGDTVLVTAPDGKKPVFRLRTNGVAVITRITAKGALGFAFDAENTFLSKRFQKVELLPVQYGSETASGYGMETPQSGDLVVARPGRHSRNPENIAKFVLPVMTALTFRGVTLDKGNFILDGYADHEYSPSRFSVVTPVAAF